MKTAEEVARDFIQYWKDDFRLAPLADLLDAYAEERVRESDIKLTAQIQKVTWEEARAEALEEAAKVAEGSKVYAIRHVGCADDTGRNIASQIRALKDKP